ncbi:hypothetical protein [Conyzicola nivalis]|uniref:hypothetical protein n=1 Tax=Conyzicola nivalis TaxID=1477021 RepID=UPI001E571175|nr:hypothetical protein [Conyzicola nivalis]
MLVASGTIPELNAEEARFEYWKQIWLTTIEHPEDRTLLRRYSRWGLKSQSHQSVPSNPKAKYRRHRGALRQVAALLNAARDIDHTVATLPQRELDQFLNGSPAQQDALAHFTQWLRTTRLSRLVVAYRRNELEGYGFSTDHRWKMARLFIERAEIPIMDRVGALLILLYGMQATRVVAIERSQVSERNGKTMLTIGSEPIELPAPLDEAVQSLLKLSHLRSPRWLFVGRHPGEHLTARALSRRLATYGMSTGSARATALMELAQQMHPRVLSDLLGVSIATASAWWRLAGGDWAAYPPLREQR